MHEPTSWATFAGRRAAHAVECVDLAEHPERLDEGGLWFVVADFEADLGRDGSAHGGGRARAWRFADVAPATAHVRRADPWRGPPSSGWATSLDRDAYVRAVETVRERVRRGDVYQVNVCRVLSASLPATTMPDGARAEPDAASLAARLAAGNPAPYAAAVHVPASSGLDPVWVVSASPELYLDLDLDIGPGGGVVRSGPIKGTARTASGLADKDRAENVMITDLVRNDLQRVCGPGSVEVVDLLAVEEHPGLVHLVSRVRGELAPRGQGGGPGVWARLLDATFPPGSVSGAPKSSALRLVAELEPEPRGPYCGAVGWVDADAGRAELAVGIRTFWWSDGPDGGVLRFGTGAGITWGSDPEREWQETELKASRLVGLASSG